MWPGPVIETLKTWFQQWAQQYLLPTLKAQLKMGLMGILDGMMDVLLLLGVPAAAILGSNAYMNRQ